VKIRKELKIKTKKEGKTMAPFSHRFLGYKGQALRVLKKISTS